MRRQLRKILTLCAVGVSAAACTDRTTPVSPTAPEAPRASVAATEFAQLTPFACDFTLLKTDARVFAASNNDPLFTIIGDLHGCYSCLKAVLTQTDVLRKIA